MKKEILSTFSNTQSHWVGDGFPVRTLFSSNTLGHHLSPFLMLDFAGPAHFPPTGRRLGVGEHPHRGFETVTIVYEGELEHRDSSGGGGRIGPGDVQWMTAGSGVLHAEYHSRDFARTGGTLDMVQLWVNLPSRHKMTDPRYQSMLAPEIPSVVLPSGAGHVRVIAGEYMGKRGPAHTFTPMDVWDLRLAGGHAARFTLPEGRTLTLVALRGRVRVNGDQQVDVAHVIVLDDEGTDIEIEALDDATVLLLSGEPIDESIVAHGPFVMNTTEEIHQALADFNSGRFGRVVAKDRNAAPPG
jgi:redox-sensitive bicupin YhaK (pirin superfamily)